MIDILLLSSDLKKHMVKMHIDEERSHVLTRIRKTKIGVKVKESDHNTILTKFNHKVMAQPLEEKIKVYNLKNKDCQEKVRRIYLQY